MLFLIDQFTKLNTILHQEQKQCQPSCQLTFCRSVHTFVSVTSPHPKQCRLLSVHDLWFMVHFKTHRASPEPLKALLFLGFAPRFLFFLIDFLRSKKDTRWPLKAFLRAIDSVELKVRAIRFRPKSENKKRAAIVLATRFFIE